MKKVILLIISITGFLFSFSVHSAEISDKLKSFIEKLESEQSNIQGSAIAILVKGEVIYKKTFGNKKGENNRINEDTLFGLASLSKPVSTIAIILMAEKNSLNFDKKIKLPYIKHDITLSNILSHTTGYKFSGTAQIEKGLSRKQFLEILEKQKPDCNSGKCYGYSNAMFSLVDEALKLQGLNLNDAVSNLSTTLKTQGIKLLPIKQSENFAYPHSKKHILPFPSQYQKIVPASAGIFASLNGMIKFYRLSFGYRPDLILQKTLDKIYQPIKINNDVFKWHINFPFEESKIKSYYSLGWRILKVDKNPNANLIFHSGYINGARAFIGYIPSKEIGIIILSNDSAAFPVQNGINFWGEIIKSGEF